MPSRSTALPSSFFEMWCFHQTYSE
jgi:hypothetical protein